ncbi:MAG: UDP-2,3-diacylglucosamine diphosphatase [Candidatus Accumulibacter sp.]|jgi:UDP-2,3-diacylglucosamine hydrolase|nr:UDP-2,3-diacylglucosamine diphosphatase [Accumulibacter sp.]
MIHFVSDIHLSSQTPATANRFLGYLDETARRAERLFILGDLFEAWAGDDGIDAPENAFFRTVVEALSRLTSAGVGVALMHGNRDFLLDRKFSARTSVRIIPDPYLLTTPTRRFVLSHGDMLCADDAEYMALRGKVRSREWQDAFLARPLAERETLVASFRRQSETAKLMRPSPYGGDLCASAVDDFLRTHGCATFIHGHTHLPATHEHSVDGVRVERWVLADWTESAGEYLSWDGQRLTRNAV